MTDNEIVKALEEWRKELIADYQRLQLLDAPMNCFEESHANTITKLTNALDLINRQNEEKEVMQAYIDCLRAENENLNDILYDAEGVNLVNYWHQQCEIAENGIKNFAEENEKLKAEIERLKAGIKVDLEGYATEYDNKIKAEAYKEFAEKVNKMLNSRASFGNLIESITCENIVKEVDNILKKLAGDEE
jgi:hypothetical protein